MSHQIPPDLRGYHIAEAGVLWGFELDGELVQGAIDFREIAEAGPEAILLFGMLVQLGRYQGELSAATDSMTALAHALLEITKQLQAAMGAVPPSPEEMMSKAEAMVERLMGRMRGPAPTTKVVTPPAPGT